MATIQIGTRIASKRKEKGITQEELATHLGVSKPAVSKWESGQSYPDILLLPVLAAYFDISVDELIGYEPQMTKDEIRKLSRRLAEEFVNTPFEQVYEECQTYLKKYFSCWQLQFQLGLLLLNHASLAGSAERSAEVIDLILEIFKRVEKSSGDVNLAKQAVQLQALCYLSQNKPIDAIDLLEELDAPFMQSDVLLVKAYQMKGDMDKALEYLQGYVYVNLMSILGAASDFFGMYTTDPVKMDQFYSIYNRLSELFDVEQMHPAMLLQVKLSAALVFAMQDKKEEAMDALEHCLELKNKLGNGKIHLKGNSIFDRLEEYFKDIDVETQAPRNMEIVWKDVNKIILHNPAFEKLKEDERYRRMLKRLEN